MDSYQHISIREHGDVVVVDFTKRPMLDAWTAREFGEELRDVAGRADCGTLLLNFAAVTWLASAMLEKLVMVHRMMASRGGSLILAGVGPDIREVLALTKLDQLFRIGSDEADALLGRVAGCGDGLSDQAAQRPARAQSGEDFTP